MAGVRVIASGFFLYLSVTACGNDPGAVADPGAPEVISRLARLEASVEDFDVCAAIEDTAAADELTTILDANSVFVEGAYVESEDALSQVCRVTSDDNQGGDTELSVELSQFSGAGHLENAANARAIFADCVVQPDATAKSLEVRVYCAPDLSLTADADILRDEAIRPWPGTPDDGPAEDYVRLLDQVLLGISRQD